MLRSAAAAAAAPGPPSGAASFPPPGASRASAGDGRGGRGGRRPPPPPPRHLLPPPRLPPLAQRGGLGARGAPCWRRLPLQKTPRRAPGRSRARRPGRRAPAGGLARRARSLTRSLALSLSRSTHRVSSARRRRGACGAAEDARGAKLASPLRGGSHGAGAAAGPARGLLRVHCVRLSVSPRGAGPGERRAWAEPRTGGSSGRRGTCAARAASPPRGRGSPPHPLLPSLDLCPAPL